MNMNQKPHISVKNLGLSYGEKTAFHGVSLNLNRGMITSVVGPSGCGKTSFITTLNRLCDLTEGCQAYGKIELDGRDIRESALSVVNLRKRVGMIFQKPNPFPLSIRKNLEFPLREHGLRGRDHLNKAVQEALIHVGLWEEVKDRLETPAMALSGGQQQRLCIARAIALKPEVLLMDEPCSALDPIASATIENLILQLRGQYTIVIVTHNLAQAQRISDFTAFFWFVDGAGQLVEFGPTRQIFQSPTQELTAAYMAGRKG